ncbi:MAG: phosphoribosylamine--glycine ligase [Leptonema sp. (in: bacteria)]
MNVLLLGSGGREHCIYWKILNSPLLDEIYVYPGNGGILEEHRVRKEQYGDFFSDSFKNLIQFIDKKEIDLVIVGPEQPLVEGIADILKNHCLVFGPSKEGAKIEGSKSWARNFMKQFGLPSANYQTFTNSKEAKEYIKTINPPYVIKADGLAAGKGVSVVSNIEEANQILTEILDKKIFGSAGDTILIEEFLEGKEASVFAFCDGTKALIMQPARDYKRAYDKNLGPNTGGMGSLSPVEYIDQELLDYIQKEIFDKAIYGFQQLGISYKGILYAGLMIHNYKAKIVEFNCRFGDPETQVLLPLLKEDLLELCYQTAIGKINTNKISFKEQSALGVVIAAEGYPQNYKKNINLTNFLKQVPQDLIVFHAGTEFMPSSNEFYSTGGRILNFVSLGNSIEENQKKIYDFLNKFPLKGTFFRKDIGILY